MKGTLKKSLSHKSAKPAAVQAQQSLGDTRGLGSARQVVSGSPALPLRRSAGGFAPRSVLQSSAKRFLQGCHQRWGKATQYMQKPQGKLSLEIFHTRQLPGEGEILEALPQFATK